MFLRERSRRAQPSGSDEKYPAVGAAIDSCDLAATLVIVTEEMDTAGDAWLALGLRLRMLTTTEGGRSKDLGLPGSEYEQYQYRPNWGLPGVSGTEQVGAFVLWLSPFPARLGDTVRAVIVPFAPGSLPLWEQVRVGDELRMFEGPRVCGKAIVEQVWDTTAPLPEEDAARFVRWASATGTST